MLGREFDVDLLGNLAELDPADLELPLERLLESGLVLTRPGVAGVYAFKHALVQEAAYNSLLRRDRQVLHKRAAEVLAQKHPRRLALEPEVVARHYEAAGEALAAIPLYQAAANLAVGRSVGAEAIAHFEAALRLIEGLADRAAHAVRELELVAGLAAQLIAVRGYPDPSTMAVHQRAMALCDSLGEAGADHRAAILGGLAICYVISGVFDQGVALCEQLLAEDTGPGEIMHHLTAHTQVSVPLFLMARYEDCIEHGEKGLELYDRNQHARYLSVSAVDMAIAGHISPAWSLWILGRVDEGLAHDIAAVEHAQALQHPHSLTIAHQWRGLLHLWRGEWAEAAAHADISVEMAERHGFVAWAGLGRIYGGAARVAMGGGEAARQEMLHGLSDPVRAHLGAASLYWTVVANVELKFDALDSAREAVETAWNIARLTAQPVLNPELYRLEGELVLRAGDRLEAERCFREAMSEADRTGALSLKLRAALSLARMRPDSSQILADLRRARAAITQGAGTGDIRKVDAYLESAFSEAPLTAR